MRSFVFRSLVVAVLALFVSAASLVAQDVATWTKQTVSNVVDVGPPSPSFDLVHSDAILDTDLTAITHASSAGTVIVNDAASEALVSERRMRPSALDNDRTAYSIDFLLDARHSLRSSGDVDSLNEDLSSKRT